MLSLRKSSDDVSSKHIQESLIVTHFTWFHFCDSKVTSGNDRQEGLGWIIFDVEMMLGFKIC